MSEPLKSILSQRGVTFDTVQFDVLRRVIGDSERVRAWDDFEGDPRAETIVVDEPPRQSMIDAFCRRLSPQSTVLIPFSENPGFDFLKSKLRCHGIIGAVPPAAPHQIWWGGLALNPKNSAKAIQNSCVVSAARCATEEESAALDLAKHLNGLNISYRIERSDHGTMLDDHPARRSQLLLDAWANTDKPLIWLEPQHHSDLTTISVDLDNADFAAIPVDDARFSMSFLYFGRSRAAHDLLKSWNSLAKEFPSLPSSYLLDAAWALALSQRHLVSVWIPQKRKFTPAAELTEEIVIHPAQREARRAHRNGAPEPYAVMRGHTKDRGTVTMIVTGAAGTTVRDTAQTVVSAFNAFTEDNGWFAGLGVVICSDDRDCAATLQKIPEGWILLTQAGVQLELDTFRTLDQVAQNDRPVFVLPKSLTERQTRNGKPIRARRSQATLFRAELANGPRQSWRDDHAAPLQLICN